MLFYDATARGMGKCCCDNGEAVNDVGWTDNPNMLPHGGANMQYPRQDPMALPGNGSRRNEYPYNDNQYKRHPNGYSSQGLAPNEMRQVNNRRGNNPLDSSSLGRNNDPYRNGNTNYPRDNSSLPSTRRGTDSEDRNKPSNMPKGGFPASSSNLLAPSQLNKSRQVTPRSSPHVSPGSSPDNRNLPSQSPNERPLDSHLNGKATTNSNSSSDIRSISPNHPPLPTLPKPAVTREQSKSAVPKLSSANPRKLQSTPDVQKQAQSNLSRSRAGTDGQASKSKAGSAKKGESKKGQPDDDKRDEDSDADDKSIKSRTKKQTASRGKATTGASSK